MHKNNISVDKVYTSENLKCYKPNPMFFKKIPEDNGLSPQEVLFIGDSVNDDILGLKVLGIKQYLLIGQEKTKILDKIIQLMI